MELQKDDTLPRWVVGDGSRIRQVLLNLLGNAIKFTDHGSVTLRASHRSNLGRNVVLRVIDTGIGIREEAQWQLFQPFHQLESGHHRRHGGTGLGLAISHHLVNAMQGRIRVDSRWVRARPSRWSCHCPRSRPRVSTFPQGWSTSVWPKGCPMRILLAEDNPINQMIMLEMLEELGYKDVPVAENGIEVLSMLKEREFDLILMDLQMPGLGGLETSRRIIEQMGEQRPRLLALTRPCFKVDREACLEAGMDEHLAKPVSFEVLAEALERWAPDGR